MWFLYRRIDTAFQTTPWALKPRNRAMYAITNYDIACYRKKFVNRFFQHERVGSFEYVYKEK